MTLGRLPGANAMGLSLGSLQAIQTANLGYDSYFTAEPDIVGSIVFNYQYIPPQNWNGSTWVASTTDIVGYINDNDTLWTYWYMFGWLPLSLMDPITGVDLGSTASGYEDTQAWNYTDVRGRFRTTYCLNQTEVMSEKPIRLVGDDAGQIVKDTETLDISKSIYVVLPNAHTTTRSDHFLLDNRVHTGDTWTHTVFHRPTTVSIDNPAPYVPFWRYIVQEGNWAYYSSSGLNEQEVRNWITNNKSTPEWQGSWPLNSANSFPDTNMINRWLVGSLYPSFRNEGEIVLIQGWRVIEPIDGNFWECLIKYHLIGPSTDYLNPGECHVRKQCYSNTSTNMTWTDCSNHLPECPYQ